MGVSMRIEFDVDSITEELLSRHGVKLDLTPSQVAKDLVLKICADLFQTVPSAVKFHKAPPKGHELLFQTAMEVWRERETERTRVESERSARRERNQKRYLTEQLSKVDLSVLERGPGASGYKNVMPNGVGWRAFVAHKGVTTWLRTRRDPALAAWDRYQWMTERGLPYGEEAALLKRAMLTVPDSAEPQMLASLRASNKWLRGEAPYNDETEGQELAKIRVGRAIAEATTQAKPLGRPLKRIEVTAEGHGKVSWIQGDLIVVEYVDRAISYSPLVEIQVEQGSDVEVGMLLGTMLGAKTRLRRVVVPSVAKLLHEPNLAPRATPASPEYRDQLVLEQRAKLVEPPVSEVATERSIPPLDAPALAERPKAKPIVGIPLTPEMQGLQAHIRHLKTNVLISGAEKRAVARGHAADEESAEREKTLLGQRDEAKLLSILDQPPPPSDDPEVERLLDQLPEIPVEPVVEPEPPPNNVVPIRPSIFDPNYRPQPIK